MKISFSKTLQEGKNCARITAVFAVLLGCHGAGEPHAEVVVVPNAMATTDGNSSITADASPTPGAIRYTVLLDASQFGALSGPSLLTQIAERPDKSPGNIGPQLATYRIYASTTTRSVDDMSTTFDENVGPDRTLVFDGTLTRTTARLPGPGDTLQFDIVAPFTTPFRYDPAAGNLLLDFQYSSAQGESLRWDSVKANPASRGMIGIGSPTVETGVFIDAAVYQFTFEAPPLVTIRASQAEVCWNSKSNVTYQVQYRSEMTANLWTTLGNCVQGTGSVLCIHDSIVAGQPQRFYQVAATNCVPQL